MQIYTKPLTFALSSFKKVLLRRFQTARYPPRFQPCFWVGSDSVGSRWVESAGEWPIKGEKSGVSQLRYTTRMMVDMLPKGERFFANGATGACTRWDRCRLKVRPQASLYRIFRS